MKGLLADINVQGQVAYLAQRMQAGAWADFWQELELVLYSFEDLGLAASSTDAAIWNVCQREELILITDNRNLGSDDSMEATIQRHGTAESLPIFTIADKDKVCMDSAYAERVIEKLYDYLLGIDDVRGAGRLYLP